MEPFSPLPPFSLSLSLSGKKCEFDMLAPRKLLASSSSSSSSGYFLSRNFFFTTGQCQSDIGAVPLPLCRLPTFASLSDRSCAAKCAQRRHSQISLPPRLLASKLCYTNRSRDRYMSPEIRVVWAAQSCKRLERRRQRDGSLERAN